MKFNKILFIGAVLFFTSSMFVGCRKKADTIVNVIVRDVNNQIVTGASVTLDASPTVGTDPKPPSDLYPMVSTTGSSGTASFNFNEVYQLGQAGVALLDIIVVSSAGNGTGIVKVVEETTTTEIVFI